MAFALFIFKAKLERLILHILNNKRKVGGSLIIPQGYTVIERKKRKERGRKEGMEERERF